MNPAADRRTLLSTLWIFVILNYIFADVFVLIFSPEFYQGAVARTTGKTVLAFAILVEILIAMVVFSRILPKRTSRWANIIAGLLGTVWVALTLGAGAPAHYVFFASVEIVSTLFIVWYAWTWQIAEGKS